MSTNVSLKQLLEAGAHFGHQTKRWNPKMKPYIFGEKNGIYILDLQKTLRLFRKALAFAADAASKGQTFLFIGTKKQAQPLVQAIAESCDNYYITNRWLGGMLTNFETIKTRIARLNELEKQEEGGLFEVLPKKEALMLSREKEKLAKNLTGIKDMKNTPDVVFIIDPKKEAIALNEANKLGIKVIAMVDTNCDPDGIDFPIPANDDAIKTIKLIGETLAATINEGGAAWKKKKEEAEAKAAAERAAVEKEKEKEKNDAEKIKEASKKYQEEQKAEKADKA